MPSFFSANRAQIAARAAGQVGALMVADISREFRQAVLDAGESLRNNQLRTLADVFHRPQTDHAARERIHTRIGQLAQAAVLDSYDTLVIGGEGPASRTHYRAGGNRLANGVLRRALSNPANIYEAYSDGLRFINIDGLDREAAHWHRIAFGVVPTGMTTSSRFNVRFGSLVNAAIGLEETPSPTMFMPFGLFVDPGTGQPVKKTSDRLGEDIFRPIRRTANIPTLGFVGKNFFDAGVQEIAEQWGPAYEQYYADLVKEANRQLQTASLRRITSGASRYGASAWASVADRIF